MTGINCRKALTLATVAATLLTAALAASAPTAAAAARGGFPHFDHGVRADEFWAGYTETGDTFTSVSAQWRVPSLDCDSTPDSVVSPWVGLDGFDSDTVEQIGFDQDCSNGRVKYEPWVEMYPKHSVYFDETMEAGDHIAASVDVDGQDFTLTETDSTQGWSKTYHETGDYQLNSAEVILEDLGSGIQPVADFGALNFTDATANDQSLGDAGTPNSTDLTRSGTRLTANSQLDGDQFSIRWRHA
ncbi:hypothetical protein P3T36_001031 [Kitasatospora sp. MAP12-15]|uniref:G1 family glutamic endopeptidase n=1 Tax=unclassified Kitasatospora TaxID=2633591 RepID=UPI002476357D|nr:MULTISPECIES: G1 family glutamic endopeptidase [unclassified Kitasatospora]MDH6114679.1 hypothetical protein [Kitasatospora sp. MAP12-44]MDH6131553.1 hypothetical protein [Kitasatospora sp. MAA4]